MTFGDKAEVRRAKVGTRVLAFGFAILAVLGSFWTIVWFIRSYVEPPRVTISPALALAAADSKPAPPPAPMAAPEPTGSISQAKPTGRPAIGAAAPSITLAQAAPVEQPSASSSIADRWMPVTPAPAPEPAPAAAPQPEPTAAAAAPASAEPPADDIAESAVPAISGPAPLPRRKPLQTAAVRARTTEPPLPRPRPDGPAPQSVWTAVPNSDDRYQAGQ
ncbi:MAG: hypothetical protein WDO17_14050 [Alphaproteobacteria bacterium]